MMNEVELILHISTGDKLIFWWLRWKLQIWGGKETSVSLKQKYLYK